MHKVRICLEINGVAEDDQGNPCPAGLQITLGETDEEIPYEELTKDLDISKLLAGAGLSSFAKPEDVTIITPEEYDERYGDEE